jgi:hypothetical protein
LSGFAFDATLLEYVSAPITSTPNTKQQAGKQSDSLWRRIKNFMGNHDDH